MSLKQGIKKAVHAIGLVGLWREFALGSTLTVVMYHRVLPERECEAADPGYTVSEGFFSDCVAFFKRHYNVVSLDDVAAAVAGSRKLPRKALLITFDDGWDDNLRHAAPILLRAGAPALVFLAADPVSDQSPRWWQSTLLDAVRESRLSYEEAWAAASDDAEPPPSGRDRQIRLLHRFGRCDAVRREAILAPYATGKEDREMLTPERAIELPAAGLSVGAHGASHLALTLLEAPGEDLGRVRGMLERFWPGFSGRAISLSFPHGRYSSDLLAQATSRGFSPLFTSDAIVNRAEDGKLSPVLGRIEIPAHELQNDKGRLVPERLAEWLLFRARARLSPSRGALA